MINPNTGQRELAYTVNVDSIIPIDGAENVELAVIGGWQTMVHKKEFAPGSIGIYFEIDSKLPKKEPFLFMGSKHFKVTTQKYFKGTVISQGLLMSLQDFNTQEENQWWLQEIINNNQEHYFLTDILNITYYDPEENKQKNYDKYQKQQKNNYSLIYKIIHFFFKNKQEKNNTKWPTGKFPNVKRTDQERVENMPWVLNDKTPYIVTEKCDGTSATYILEKINKHKYNFYVCSRNVRFIDNKQKSFFDDNIYWQIAEKYDIKNKMIDYLNHRPKDHFVCWQGEICGPKIQNNPHKLKDLHLFLFHMIDEFQGKYDITHAKIIWDFYNMESVPIISINDILPNNFEELKADADGFYDPSVCEGQNNCIREGLVYYKTTDPYFSFKNVSTKYLIKNGQ